MRFSLTASPWGLSGVRFQRLYLKLCPVAFDDQGLRTLYSETQRHSLIAVKNGLDWFALNLNTLNSLQQTAVEFKSWRICSGKVKLFQKAETMIFAQG